MEKQFMARLRSAKESTEETGEGSPSFPPSPSVSASRGSGLPRSTLVSLPARHMDNPVIRNFYKKVQSAANHCPDLIAFHATSMSFRVYASLFWPRGGRSTPSLRGQRSHVSYQ